MKHLWSVLKWPSSWQTQWFISWFLIRVPLLLLSAYMTFFTALGFFLKVVFKITKKNSSNSLDLMYYSNSEKSWQNLHWSSKLAYSFFHWILWVLLLYKTVILPLNVKHSFFEYKPLIKTLYFIQKSPQNWAAIKLLTCDTAYIREEITNIIFNYYWPGLVNVLLNWWLHCMCCWTGYHILYESCFSVLLALFLADIFSELSINLTSDGDDHTVFKLKLLYCLYHLTECFCL